MAGFGGSVKLTGESEYRNALQRCTEGLKAMSSALKGQVTEFNSSDSSMKKNISSQEQLSNSIKAQEGAVAKAKSQLAQYSVEITKQTQTHSTLTREYKQAVTELDRIKQASGETSDEYKKQSEVVNTLGDKLAQSQLKLNENKEAYSNLKKEISNSNKSIDEAKNSLNGLGQEEDNVKEKTQQCSEGFTVFKGILANLGTQAINSAMNGIKSMGSAMVDLGKQAVSSYASYEQLTGGVETLFKDSAPVVEKYANEAYKTSGLSANQYMETVTSFSASMISSLGGNTAKAAEMSNQAIVDMSDNANKMGTDMTSIQNAYQGFAKQNYTMLDNLKLGRQIKVA